MQLVLAGEAPARRRYLWYVATLVDDTGVLRILHVHVFEMFFVFSLGRGGSRVDDRCTGARCMRPLSRRVSPPLRATEGVNA